MGATWSRLSARVRCATKPTSDGADRMALATKKGNLFQEVPDADGKNNAVNRSGYRAADCTFLPRHEPVEIRSMPLAAYVLDSGATADIAFCDAASGRTIRHADLPGMAGDLAAGLASRCSFKTGQVIAFLLPNLPEYAVSFIAVAASGGIVTTLNPMYTAPEICHQIQDSGAVLMLTVNSFLDKAYAAVAGTPISHVIVIDAASDEDDTTHSPPLVAYAGLLSRGRSEPRVQPVVDLGSTVVVPYSSGTSGLPKGVELTHRNLVANLCQLGEHHIQFSSQDVLVGVLPFFHIYGMVVIMFLALHAGATVISMPAFEPAGFLRILKERAVTFGPLAPPVVGFLAKHPSVDALLPLDSLQDILCAAAPLGGDLARAVQQRLGVSCVRQGYGLTELSPACHVMPKELAASKLESVGTLLPNQEQKLISPETGAALGVGDRGEVWVRGPNVMKGYLNKPDATAGCVDADGYFHTGDIGLVDEDGCLSIVDRLKELIKVRFTSIHPSSPLASPRWRMHRVRMHRARAHCTRTHRARTHHART